MEVVEIVGLFKKKFHPKIDKRKFDCIRKSVVYIIQNKWCYNTLSNMSTALIKWSIQLHTEYFKGIVSLQPTFL